MTRQEAISKVSDRVAAWVSATMLNDLFTDEEIRSDKDAERLAAAMDVVETRLRRMGKRNGT